MTMKTQQLKSYGVQQNSSKRDIYSDTILSQETRKTSNRQPNFTPKTTGKRTKNHQNQKKEINHKDQSKNMRKSNGRNNSKD